MPTTAPLAGPRLLLLAVTTLSACPAGPEEPPPPGRGGGGADMGGGGGRGGGASSGGSAGAVGGGGGSFTDGGGGPRSDGSVAADGARPIDAPAPPGSDGAAAVDAPVPPPGKCDFTPRANATQIKLKFETIQLTGVSTSDINKATGSKDGITELKFVPGRSSELLLLQKRGRLSHMKLEAEAGVATLVKAYDIGGVHFGEDCGLVSLAFDPEFASNKLLYLGYCAGANTSKLVRYRWEADALSDPVDIMTWSASGRTAYHSVGSMGFDAQGILWVFHGEFEQGEQAQNLSSNLGKLLRFIPSRKPGEGGYLPAPDNPFASEVKPRSAIYAWGFRSPWRGLLTARGHWVIGDVQDQANEEVNVITAKGQNFGWPSSSGPCSGSCSAPVTHYRGSHDPYDGDGNPVKEARQGRSVWVGAQYGDCGNDRYRGALTGVTLFGDFYAGWVRGMILDDTGKLIKDQNLGEQGAISSMVQRDDGFLFATSLGPYGTAAGEKAALLRVVPQ